MTPEEEKDLIRQHIQYKRDRYWLLVAIVILVGKTIYDDRIAIPEAVNRKVDAVLEDRIRAEADRRLSDNLVEQFKQRASDAAVAAEAHSKELELLYARWADATPVFHGSKVVFRTHDGQGISLSNSGPPVVGRLAKDLEELKEQHPLEVLVLDKSK